MEKLLGLSQERGCTVFAVMRDEPALGQFQRRTIDSILDFVELVESVNERLNRPIAVQPANPLKVWCTAWLDEVGLFREIRRMEKDEETAENRVRNIVDLLDSMDPGFVPADRPVAERLHRFLEHISLDRERDEDDEIGDAVTLITVHSCKGLEFPHVYIAGVEDGLIPHSRSKAEGTLDEERRLFYVAITRAQVTLTMSHCENRRKFGELIPCHPSPFLKEIPEELVVHGNEAASEPARTRRGLIFSPASRRRWSDRASLRFGAHLGCAFRCCMAGDPLEMGNTNNNSAGTDNGEAKPEPLDFIREIVAADLASANMPRR